MLDGVEKPPSVYTMSNFFACEWLMKCVIVLTGLWEGQLPRRRKLCQSGPEPSAQAAVQLKSSSIGLVDLPLKYTDPCVVWIVSLRGGRVMTKQRCSRRHILL